MDKYARMNEIFRAKLEGGEDGLKTARAAGAAYIKERLREESFARKVLPPDMISKAELQRNENGDGVYKLVDIEPDSSAISLNFRAESPAKYVTGTRFKINFYKVASEKFEKAESELLAYEMPITKILEENTVFDIQAQEDSKFYAASVAAIAGSARDAVSTEVTITRATLASSLKLLHAQKLNAKCFLMTEELFDDVLGWDYTTVGGDMAGKITVSGYDEPTLLKRKLVITNKADIVGNREVWLYAPPEFLGRFYVLEDTKFWIDKNVDMIEWVSWEIIGMGIGNAKSIARLTYTG